MQQTPLSLRNTSNDPFINLCTLGAAGHGKTTLLAALTRVLFATDEAKSALAVEHLNAMPDERVRGIGLAYTEATYLWNGRQYRHRDYRSHLDCIKGVLIEAQNPDGAVLVMSVSEGPQPQAREQLKLVSRLKVPGMVLFLNGMDRVEDAELLAVVELEISELLAMYGYARALIIRGSALQALESQGDLSRSDPAVTCIWDLLDALRACNVPAVPVREQPFLMVIQNTFDLKKRGVAAVGYIERGCVRVGESVDVLRFSEEVRTVTVMEIEIYRKKLKQGVAGEHLACILSDIEKTNISYGDVLVQPGSLRLNRLFTAQVYILSQTEDGRRIPFFNGYRPNFYIRHVGISGTVTLPEEVERVLPGELLEITVRLNLPMALEEGLRFHIREGGHVVGIGVCTSIQSI